MYFQNNKVNAKNAKLRNIMNEILNCENSIKDAENICSRNIQAEQTRDQDIKFAQQQKSKLENDFSLTINEMGSGNYLFDLILTNNTRARACVCVCVCVTKYTY